MNNPSPWWKITAGVVGLLALAAMVAYLVVRGNAAQSSLRSLFRMFGG